MAGIRDVARRAGVSPTTVSRFLNEDVKLSITNETKKRIEEAVKELDYKKGQSTRSRTASIAIITTVSEAEEIDDPYFRSIRLGIFEEAKKQKIAANRFFRLDSGVKLEELEAFGCLIILGHLEESFLEEIYQHNNELLVVDDPFTSEKYDTVYSDIEGAARQNLDRLYKNGHRRIAFIGGVHTSHRPEGVTVKDDADVRAVTYKKWMAERGLEANIVMKLGEWNTQNGMKLAEELIEEQKGDLPTAIMVASDPMAVGVYRALQKAEVKIPKDISLVSFDNIEVAEYLTPPLSTVELRTMELGKQAIRFAKEKIDGVRSYPIRCVIPGEIIIRESEQKY
ncbi:LacI family DNA-binding transcriptional regulator [Enterococcus sp. LJL51]|uniref:LacI family DNA-binding transcriptional regulator n=1 Tax=Enterococcus sp. LJL51 TaxID=3416656 RepID=UPI003CFA5338